MFKEAIQELDKKMLEGNAKEKPIGLLKDKDKTDSWESFFNTKK